MAPGYTYQPSQRPSIYEPDLLGNLFSTALRVIVEWDRLPGPGAGAAKEPIFPVGTGTQKPRKIGRYTKLR
jgi:hypothetical protein